MIRDIHGSSSYPRRMTEPAPTGEPMPDPRVEPTISIVRAGRLLGVSRNTAYEAAKSGQIPTIPVGRRRLVPTTKLLELLGVSEATERVAG